MLYWLYIEYEVDGMKKTIEKFFNSKYERLEFIANFKKRRK